ncbi:hypothetical protein ABG768_018937 [Culter alburnus]|uniref:Uncharacterized protein n=1 Tax=Culter alburnus TaxID=194366 RepID=A0AAW2ATU2_CULAL
MNIFCSHGTGSVKDLQSMEAVSRALNEGIVSICNICKSLKNVHVNPTTDMCSNYNQIREHIEHAEQCLKTSETRIKEKLGYLDKQMENLIRKKLNIEQQKKEKCMTMNTLRTEKTSAEELLRYSNEALKQAEKDVESAKYALRTAQDRRNTGEGVAIAGGALLAIPIIGWIAGPIMLGVGLGELNEASNAIRAAEEEQRKFNSQVEENTKKVTEYQSKISGTQNEIEQISEALKRIEREVEEVQNNLENTGNIQEMVRSAVNLLSVLSGRVNVLEKQTQHFVHWLPVVKIMEDVMKAVINIAENRFLYGDGNPGLINTLRENVGGLVALCNSPSNSEYGNYY